jgi:hypothetical protein
MSALLLERRRLRRREGIKMVLTQIESSIEWLQLTQSRDEWCMLMNTVMNFQVSYNVGNLWTS